MRNIKRRMRATSLESEAMSKTARTILGLIVFVASYVVLTFYIAPLLTQQGGSAPLDEAAMARFAVLVAFR